MALKNNWVNGDVFTPAAANDMANAVNGATNVTVDGAAASSYEIDPTPLTASDVGAYTRAEVDEAIEAAKRGPVITASPSITSPRINSIYDTNGSEILRLGAQSGSTNFMQINNGTGSPTLEVKGSSTNVSLIFTPQGTGGIGYYLGTGQTSAAIFAAGTATNINIDLTPQGSGVVRAGGVEVVTVSGSQTLVGKTITGNKETVYAITDGAAFEINPANGGIQTLTLGASRTPKATSFTSGQSVTLMIAATSYTVTWTDGTLNPTWIGGVAPVLSATNQTVIVLWKVGATIYASLVGYA